jgi:hypothetical protein
VHQHRARFYSVVNIQNRRQLFVVDFDQLQAPPSAASTVNAATAATGSPTVAHFFRRDDRLIFKYRPVKRLDTFIVQNIVPRQHRHHAGNFLCLGSLDARDPRMGIRTAEESSHATSPARSCRPNTAPVR